MGGENLARKTIVCDAYPNQPLMGMGAKTPQ